jgi:hypothetical protein
MKQRAAIILLVLWMVFVVMAVSDLYFAAFVYKPSQNVFAQDSAPDYDRLIKDLENGQINIKPYNMLV